MTLDAWLTENKVTSSEFARRINRKPSTVHKYRHKGRVPDALTMPLIISETKGQVQPNDFFLIAPARAARSRARRSKKAAS